MDKLTGGVWAERSLQSPFAINTTYLPVQGALGVDFLGPGLQIS